jgi:hypothetical protein
VTGAEIRGAEALGVLTRRLKEAGDKELQKELRVAIKNALDPLRRKLPVSAREVLPRRGGLGDKVAKSKFSISRKNTSRESGLRLIAKNEYTLGKMDEGELRHPIRQRKRNARPVWVKQRITPGWASIPFDEEAAPARAEIERAMQRVIDRLDERLPNA